MICCGCSAFGVTRNTRVDVRLREQLAIVLVEAADAERVARPVEFLGDGAARGDQLGAGHAGREVLGMAAAHAADADDADADGIGFH